MGQPCMKHFKKTWRIKQMNRTNVIIAIIIAVVIAVIIAVIIAVVIN